METYVENILDNFPMLKWLGNHIANHNGFIAGGCFKNILSGEKVKDIDIFFKSEEDFQIAYSYYNNNLMYEKRYENEKCVAFQSTYTTSTFWIELIKSTFGTPEEILDRFDFTVAKFAYYKKEIEITENGITSILDKPYILYHKDFFEHLHMKRLVIDKDIPFPISTWERSYRYKGYGYNLCRESKQKLLDALRNTKQSDDELSMYNLGGWD